MLSDKKINVLNMYYDIYRYKEDQSYKDIIQRSQKCEVKNGSYYLQVYFSDVYLPEFGWKIHISATPLNAEDILTIVNEYCGKNKVPFKFMKDAEILKRSLSKVWSRSSSGKFITIYPKDTKQFLLIIDDLYQLLKKYTGPFVLSDKRYKDCKVLYYRYGSMAATDQTLKNQNGDYIIVGPNKEQFIDEPQPYYQQPEWIENPVTQKDDFLEENQGLKNGRYSVLDIISISNSGGVYRAFDKYLNKNVILKEARPGTVVLDNGMDAISLRHQEKEILQELLQSGVTSAPSIYDDFFEWEHYFISVEEIKGKNLQEKLSSPWEYEHKTSRTNDYIEKGIKLFKRILSALSDLHRIGVSIGDISLRNIMIDHRDQIRFIDFELGCSDKHRNDATLLMGTSGFRYRKYSDLNHRYQIDYEAIGLIIISYFFPTGALFDIDKKKIKKFLRLLNSQSLMPEELVGIVQELIFRSKEVDLAKIISRLDNINSRHSFIDFKKIVPFENRLKDHLRMLHQTLINEFISSSDKQPFLMSDKLNGLMDGKLGLLISIREIENVIQVDTFLPGEVISKFIRTINYKEPDFFNGYLGYVYLLNQLELDEEELTEDKIQNLLQSLETYTIHRGIAGLGLILLSLEKEESDNFRKYSVFIGDSIVSVINNNQWEKLCEGPYTEYGFFNGLSGIIYYLCELSKRTSNEIFARCAKKMLDYMIENSLIGPNKEYVLMSDEDGNAFNASFLGNAGLILAISVYLGIESNSLYEKKLLDLVNSTEKSIYADPSFGSGLAGELLVLLRVVQEKRKYIDLASFERIFNVMESFALSYNGYVYYPNSLLLNVDSSFYGGTAGIAYALAKLLKYVNEVD
ncbi:lanthionine synthetase LanC family protein [Paenibacillus sp. FSL R5-0749]|uniref:class III lanthionine synthetase LanKC N-terminal domain-containing protein n=1 Tax=Paenibacillus sp. FSL R5-0749 TaxID=2921657 RepID=UPI00315AFB3D